MALTALFPGKNCLDSTQLMNQRFQGILVPGIYQDGTIAPASGLSLTLSTFTTIGYDGMMVKSDSPMSVVLSANQNYYIVIYQKYLVAQLPTMQVQAMTTATYHAFSDPNFLLVFGCVNVPAGATSITDVMISYDERSVAETLTAPMFHAINGVDPTVSQQLSLPNYYPKAGDVLFDYSAAIFYYYTPDAVSPNPYWVPAAQYDTTLTSHDEAVAHALYQQYGSGVIAGRTSLSATAPRFMELEFHNHYNNGISTIGIGELTAVVGGNVVKTRHIDVPLTASPTAVTYGTISVVGTNWFQVSAAPSVPFTVGGWVTFSSNKYRSYKISYISSPTTIYVESRYNYATFDPSDLIKPGDEIALTPTAINGANISAGPAVSFKLQSMSSNTFTVFYPVAGSMPLVSGGTYVVNSGEIYPTITITGIVNSGNTLIISFTPAEDSDLAANATDIDLSGIVSAGTAVWQENTRYDILFLEVWRESLSGDSTPSTYTFTTAFGAKLTSAYVDREIFSGQDTPGEAGTNVDVLPFGAVAGTGTVLVTKYNVAVYSNTNITPFLLADTRRLLDPNGPLAGSPIVNSDKLSPQPYMQQTCISSGLDFLLHDKTVWYSTSSSSADGYKFAIPIAAVKRRCNETPQNGPQIRREPGNTYVFPMYSLLANGMPAPLSPADILANQIDNGVCGFLSGYESPLVTCDTTSSYVSNTVTLPPATLQFGIETVVVPHSVRLYPGHPAGTGWGEQQFILMAEFTWSRTPHMGSVLGRSCLAQLSDGRVVPMWANIEFVTTPILPDVINPMDAIGGNAGFSHIGGMYIHNTVSDERLPLLDRVLGAPILMCTRRTAGSITNQFSSATAAGWSVSYNTPNFHKYGLGSSADTSNQIHTDDVLDLRQAVIDESEAEKFMQKTTEELMTGKLRSRMAVHEGIQPNGQGTRYLDLNTISNGSQFTDVGAFSIGTLSGSDIGPNVQMIWSEAPEVYPVTVTFDANKDNSVGPAEPGYNYVYYNPDYDGNGTPKLTITAPPNSYIMTTVSDVNFLSILEGIVNSGVSQAPYLAHIPVGSEIHDYLTGALITTTATGGVPFIQPAIGSIIYGISVADASELGAKQLVCIPTAGCYQVGTVNTMLNTCSLINMGSAVPGTDIATGQNVYDQADLTSVITTTDLPFTQPTVAVQIISVNVANTSGFSVEDIIFINTAGVYSISSIQTSPSVLHLRSLGSTPYNCYLVSGAWNFFHDVLLMEIEDLLSGKPLSVTVPITRHYNNSGAYTSLMVYNFSKNAAVHNDQHTTNSLTNSIEDYAWWPLPTPYPATGVTETDAEGNPIQIVCVGQTGSSYNPFHIDKTTTISGVPTDNACTFTFYICYNRHGIDTRYIGNHGMRRLPEKIHEVELFNNSSGFVHKMAPQMLVAEIKKSSSAAFADNTSVSFTIGASDIISAYMNLHILPRGISFSTPSKIKIYGMSPVRLPDSQLYSLGNTIRYVSVGVNSSTDTPLAVTEYDASYQLDLAQTTLTVTITNQSGRPNDPTSSSRPGARTIAGGINISLIVHFDYRDSSDANSLYEWIDVIKPSKAVRAKFSYDSFVDTSPPQVTSVIGKFYPIGQYAYNMISSPLVHPYTYGSVVEQLLNIWVKNGSGTAWVSITTDVELLSECGTTSGLPMRSIPYDYDGGVWLNSGLASLLIDTTGGGPPNPWGTNEIMVTLVKHTPLNYDDSHPTEAIKIWYSAEPYQGVAKDLPVPSYNALSAADTPFNDALSSAMYATGKFLSVSPVMVTTAGSGATFFDPIFQQYGNKYITPTPRLNEYLQPVGAPCAPISAGLPPDAFLDALFVAMIEHKVDPTKDPWLVINSYPGQYIMMKESASAYRDTAHYARSNCLDFWFNRHAGSVLRLPFHDPVNSPFMLALLQNPSMDPWTNKVQCYDPSCTLAEYQLTGSAVADYGKNLVFADTVFLPASPDENTGKFPARGAISSLFEWLTNSELPSDYYAALGSIFDDNNRGICVVRRHISPMLPTYVNVQLSSAALDLILILLAARFPALWIIIIILALTELSIQSRILSHPYTLLCPGVTPLPFGNQRDYEISARPGVGAAELSPNQNMPPFTTAAGQRLDMDCFYTFMCYSYSSWMPYACRGQVYLQDYDWIGSSDVWMTIAGNPQKRVQAVQTVSEFPGATAETFVGNTDLAKPGSCYDVYIPVHRPILRNCRDHDRILSTLREKYPTHPMLTDPHA